jgi:hypothetical protein
MLPGMLNWLEQILKMSRGVAPPAALDLDHDPAHEPFRGGLLLISGGLAPLPRTPQSPIANLKSNMMTVPDVASAIPGGWRMPWLTQPRCGWRPSCAGGPGLRRRRNPGLHDRIPLGFGGRGGTGQFSDPSNFQVVPPSSTYFHTSPVRRHRRRLRSRVLNFANRQAQIESLPLPLFLLDSPSSMSCHVS